jgi:hypothetical protein
MIHSVTCSCGRPVELSGTAHTRMGQCVCGCVWELAGGRLRVAYRLEPEPQRWGPFEWSMMFLAAGGGGLALWAWLVLGCAA